MASARLRRAAGALCGAAALGGAAYYALYREGGAKGVVHASWTTNHEPSVRWDFNWDRRDVSSCVKPSKGGADDDNRYNEQVEKHKVRASRHILFVRHGQYFLDGATDAERVLTELGRRQAELTGERLERLGIKFDAIEKSTMARAQETGELIAKRLGADVPCYDCSLLEEGAPIPPEPPVGHWKPEPHQFFEEGARIEAAFRKHVHRAPPSQTKDSYTLVVCHANVIRYFVCRALQFPPEAWLRISLNHASITWLTVRPNGQVILRCLGETGHMDPQYITTWNVHGKQ